MARCGYLATLATVVAVGAAAACASTPSGECVVGADCASGVCGADGLCAGGDAGPSDGDGGDADAGAGPDGSIGACVPNHDGFIDRDEVRIQPGLTATFRVALDAPVSTAGEFQPGGTRLWDLSAAITGDSDVQVVLSPMDGAWYAESFPDATYATRLSETEELLGVFRATDDALLLLGVVSPDAGAGRTELAYDPPIKVLQFPITAGAQWSTQSTVTGVALGVPSFYSERYEQMADAVGELVTPFGTFPVIRVRVELTRTVGAAVTTSRTYAFSSECFGTVASVVSRDFESEIEFDTAKEVRRLAP